MFRAFVLIFAFFLAVSTAQPVAASKRVALVVGNSTYEHASLLPNPKNDAVAISALLKELGFEVVRGIDLTHTDFAQKIGAFRKKLRGADAGLLFYAGHGIQVHGQNYLVPIDAKLGDETSLEFETIPIRIVLKLMERETKTNLVFLDACRDNPLARNLARSMGTRSTVLGRGLAREETGLGTFIAFATQPGNVALDGKGNNSPFAAGMLKHIETPGLDVEIVMRRVREEVIKSTGGSQVPWSNSSLTGSFVFKDRPKEKPQAKPKGIDPAAIELAFWQAAKDADTRKAYQTYLGKYPKGIFAPMAAIQLEELEKAAEAEAKRQATLEAATKKQTEADRAKREAEAKQRTQRQAEAKKQAAEEAARRKAEAEQRERELADLKTKQAQDRERLARERDERAARLSALEAQAKAKAAARQEKAKEQQVASLQPVVTEPELDTRSMTMVLQNELKRVGCDPGKVDGEWGRMGVGALSSFNKYASLKLPTNAPSLEAIEAIKEKPSRVCPLACGPQFNKVNDQCVRKTCRTGQTLSARGQCVDKSKVQKPVASRSSGCPKDPKAASGDLWPFGSIPNGMPVSGRHPCGKVINCTGGRFCSWGR